MVTTDMVKLVFCCRRRQGMSVEEFQSRWLDVHGALVLKQRQRIPAMKRYVQSHTIHGEATNMLRESRGCTEPYDGITEVWFDSVDSLAEGGEDAMSAGLEALMDESQFIDFKRSSVFLTREHEIF